MRSVEIHYGPQFANEIRHEGVEKTIEKWEKLIGKPLESKFLSWGGLTIREKNEKT